MYFVIGCLCFVLATPSLVLAENFADKIYRCYQHQIPQQLMDKPWFDFLTMEKNVFLDFRVKNEEQLNQVHAWLNVTAGDCQVRVDNLTQLIKNEQRPSRISSMRLTADKIEEQFFAEYRSTKEIVQQLQKYAQKYPNLVRFNQSIGQSHEKRSLSAMHITAPSKDQVKKTKPLIVINGGLHAREWISISSAVYLIYAFLTGYNNNSEITKLLDELEFVILPLGNPDGYEFSRNSSSPSNRMWRKNRRNNGNGTFGVDLNRNFDANWGGEGSSDSPESNIYCGPKPASEPEVQAIQNYLKRINPLVGLDLHSYSQLILRPYFYTDKMHPNDVLFKKLGDGMRVAIRNSSKTEYKSMKSYDLYPASGVMQDWFTVNFGLGMTIELPDTGLVGFILPKEDIIPIGKDVTAATKYLGKFVLENMEELKKIPSRIERIN